MANPIPSVEPLPSRVNRPDTLDDDTENLFSKLPAWAEAVYAAVSEAVEASEAGANGYAFGFVAGTTAGDPGIGAARINSANVMSASSIYVSTSAANGAAIGPLFDTFDDSTNDTKGILRVVVAADPSRWALYKLIAVLAPGGPYRTLMVVGVTSSSATPFVAGETLALQYSQSGDRGAQGTPGNATSDNVRAEVWALMLAM